ncbi:tegument protein UL7 [Spheniscid alphaherpesvirus 1]|uniref:Tegument protein UL7 n=1 Tax=Spheniscid alphaherpesvirus 1 TaxID=2560777 RepID=A0A1R3TEA5_9ALPH|nr:tegument protein UL7 [Spheniscid alphaherpesvirus 1]
METTHVMGMESGKRNGLIAQAMMNQNDPLCSHLNESATLDELVERAAVGDGSVSAIVEELSWQAVPRIMCEVREVQGRQPRFVTGSVRGMRSNDDGRTLVLNLDGSNDVCETTCEEYMKQCLDQEAFRGFAFAVLTAFEDRVNTLAVSPIILKHRIVLFRPEDPVDFALCVLIMFLENCHKNQASPSLFVQISVFMRYAWKKVTPTTKTRRLLCVGVTWLLNTLMFMTGFLPFADKHVLPNHRIVKHLLDIKQPPSVLMAVYNAGVGPKFDLPKDAVECPRGAFQPRDGVLNSAFKQQWLANVLYYWWTTELEKLHGENLYYGYE